MKLIVLGANGQVGRNLIRLATHRNFDIAAYTRQTLDITSEAALEDGINEADCVINCAAYTAVDRAESEVETAWAVNGKAPSLIATRCAEKNIPFLHISTDYVFGSPLGRPWQEDDPIAPLNEYGKSKAAGEIAIRAVTKRHLILRTSWVYDVQGSNFVRTMLRLGQDRTELKIVNDQLGGPTSAEDIANALLSMVEALSNPEFSAWGTYHFSAAPPVTWYDFARIIFTYAPGPNLIPITTAEYPTPAQRPLYSVLDCRKIHDVFGVQQPDWRVSLDKVMRAVN